LGAKDIERYWISGNFIVTFDLLIETLWNVLVRALFKVKEASKM